MRTYALALIVLTSCLPKSEFLEPVPSQETCNLNYWVDNALPNATAEIGRVVSGQFAPLAENDAVDVVAFQEKDGMVEYLMPLWVRVTPAEPAPDPACGYLVGGDGYINAHDTLFHKVGEAFVSQVVFYSVCFDYATVLKGDPYAVEIRAVLQVPGGTSVIAEVKMNLRPANSEGWAPEQ